MKRQLFLFIVFAFVWFSLHAQGKNADRVIAFTGGRIYPSPVDSAIDGGLLLVRNGVILYVGPFQQSRVPATAKIINCRGLVITAGFWNCHIHLAGPQWDNAPGISKDTLAHRIQRMLSMWGVTSAFDIGSLTENTLVIRKRINSGEVPGPRVYTTGIPFAPKDANPFYIEPLKLPTLINKEQTTAVITQRLQQGMDGIKLFAGCPVSPDSVMLMPIELARTAAAIAHKYGKVVFAHPSSQKGIEVALASGIDIIAHTTPDDGQPWGPDLVDSMIRAHLYVIPTLKLWKWELSHQNITDSSRDKFIRLAIRQLHAFKEAGGPILFGTDIGYMNDYDPSEEYQLMQRAGMSFRDILAALTTTPAKKFRQDRHCGRLQAGMDADLVLLKEDPQNSIDAFSEVNATYKKGEKIY